MSEYNQNEIPQHPDEWIRAMVLQLERTERATPAQQIASQKNLLLKLARHSIETVPAYKNRLKPLVRANGKISLDGWLDVPVLKRKDAVLLGEELVSQNVPVGHGEVRKTSTSGSTGIPFAFNVSQVHDTMLGCVTTRYHRWHNYDYRKSLASIRSNYLGIASWPEGDQRASWAHFALRLENPGQYHHLNINTPIERQIEWLRRIRPNYLQTYPSNARALALAIEEGAESLKFDGILTYAEMLTPDNRAIISRVFGCHLADGYSSSECGHIALQSPLSHNWLVQSEVTYLEILNDQDQPCEPGEMGRVVVTPLHNYAQPLIRYNLGDYATLGTNDVSGLPYPVLTKIHGRIRNMFKFTGGVLIQPDFKPVSVYRFLNPKQWQVAQIGDMTLEIRIVPGGDPSKMDTEGMDQYIRDLLDMDLTINYKFVTELTNPRTGKHEDYVCEI